MAGLHERLEKLNNKKQALLCLGMEGSHSAVFSGPAGLCEWALELPHLCSVGQVCFSDMRCLFPLSPYQLKMASSDREVSIQDSARKCDFPDGFHLHFGAWPFLFLILFILIACSYCLFKEFHQKKMLSNRVLLF